MVEIKGISIKANPFNKPLRVGTLLYHEFPVTEIYSDENGQPLVLQWVDREDETDRYFIFKVTVENLYRFIFKKYSHLDLIKESENGFIIIFDGHIQKANNYKIVATDFLPFEYLPSPDA